MDNWCQGKIIRQWHPTPVLLPGQSHGQRSLVGCRPWGREESDTTEQLLFDFSLSCIGEGNGNPLQCSCLENPRDGGAWWATVYGVAQSRTRLKRLSSSSRPFAWSFSISALGKYRTCESVILLSMDMPPELTTCFLCWAFSPLYSVRSKMIWFLPPKGFIFTCLLKTEKCFDNFGQIFGHRWYSSGCGVCVDCLIGDFGLWWKLLCL